MVVSIFGCGSLLVLYMLPLLRYCLVTGSFSSQLVSSLRSASRSPFKLRNRSKLNSEGNLITDKKLDIERQYLTASKNFGEDYSTSKSFTVACVWFSFIWLSYALIRVLYLPLGLTLRDKTTANHMEDMSRMFIMGLSLLAFGNIESRVYPVRNGVIFFVQVWYYLAIYSSMYEVCPRASIGNMEISSMEAKILNTVMFMLVLWHISVHVYTAYKRGKAFFRSYVMKLVLIFGHVGVAFVLPSVYLHLHHYYWGWLLAHYPIFAIKYSSIVQAMFIAFFLHGCSVFRMESVFMDA